MKIAIFIPTYKRPHKLYEVLDNIKINTSGEYEVYFIVEGHDTPSIKQCEAMNAKYIVNEGAPCYADCINTAYKKTTEPVFFTGADDLSFMPGWAEAGLEKLKDNIMVVGVNDCYPANTTARHGTHYLVKREYIEKHTGTIDRSALVLYPFKHNWTDRVLIEVAQYRGVYDYAENSRVKHNHWSFGLAPMDETYKKGFDTSKEDEKLYHSMKHLWKK